MRDGAAMPGAGAAAIMLADASAAVRNTASRRVIGPVMCVLKIRPMTLPQNKTANPYVIEIAL